MILWLIPALCSLVAADPSLKNPVVVKYGSNLGETIPSRVTELLRSAGAFPVVIDDMQTLKDITPSLVLYFGDVTSEFVQITDQDLKMVDFEGYVIKTVTGKNQPVIIAANGNPMEKPGKVNIGAAYSVYKTLEMLGFGFLHPLEPLIPTVINLPTDDGIVHSSPKWKERGFHIHTQHPLELTEVLQGFDIPMMGPLSPLCGKDRMHYCERWEDMTWGVARLFEWSIANGLNSVEWLLLGNFKWKDLTESETRQSRLSVLTDLGHDYGLLTGADVPIAEQQQHAWYMVHTRDEYEVQVEDIHKRVDWIFEAGFDFLSTESGLSEFTHPDCDLMLDLLNEYADYVTLHWGKQASVKVHCSTGQYCDDYPDPRTGDPINFNFLPTYASTNLDVMPHTVQMYGLDDATDGAYGNDNFSAIYDYLTYESGLGNRSVIWYPETAYWVNVDIDVPLFLPLYAERRLHDARLLGDLDVHGQMNFDSGWEWSYWLQDVVAARSSWDPMSNDDDDHAFTAMLNVVLAPISKDVSFISDLSDFLADLAKVQLDILVYGIVGGVPSADLNKLSGIAYLSGADSWVDLPRMLGITLTQPDKVHVKECPDDPMCNDVVKLLVEMDDIMTSYYDRMIVLLDGQTDSLLMEMKDSMQMLQLRARQVRLIYEAVMTGDKDEKRNKFSLARAAIDQAAVVVASRQEHYRVPLDRIAGWRENPTVYRYAYLWSVKSLYYWWRDEGLAEGDCLEARISPCYLNRIDSSEVAVGAGKYALELLRILVDQYSPHDHADLIVNCIAAPPYEYQFPRDLN